MCAAGPVDFSSTRSEAASILEVAGLRGELEIGACSSSPQVHRTQGGAGRWQTPGHYEKSSDAGRSRAGHVRRSSAPAAFAAASRRVRASAVNTRTTPSWHDDFRRCRPPALQLQRRGQAIGHELDLKFCAAAGGEPRSADNIVLARFLSHQDASADLRGIDIDGGSSAFTFSEFASEGMHLGVVSIPVLRFMDHLAGIGRLIQAGTSCFQANSRRTILLRLKASEGQRLVTEKDPLPVREKEDRKVRRTDGAGRQSTPRCLLKSDDTPARQRFVVHVSRVSLAPSRTISPNCPCLRPVEICSLRSATW